jgi:hypothetical protein
MLQKNKPLQQKCFKNTNELILIKYGPDGLILKVREFIGT